MTNPTPFNDLGRQLLAELPHYTGSESFTRHGLRRNLLMTEGVTYLAQVAACRWLTDIVASHQITAKVAREPFQVWTLYVRDPVQRTTLSYVNGRTGKEVCMPGDVDAVVVCTDGNDDTAPLVVQRIPFTDFPLSRQTLWLENNTLMLPGER